jgi:hypothetical protein
MGNPSSATAVIFQNQPMSRNTEYTYNCSVVVDS